MLTFEKLRKNRSSRWLRDWFYTRLSLFLKNHKLIAIDLSTKQTLDVDLKAIQYINLLAIYSNQDKQCKISHYNTLNVKLSNFQLDKLKLGIKNCNEVTLNPSSSVTDRSNDQFNFSHRLSNF